jgi:hypothetical protein
MTCAKLFESRLPLGRRVSPPKPLASGGPREPGRSLANGCLPGPRCSGEPPTPPNSRVFIDSRARRIPHGYGEPGSSPLANSDRVAPLASPHWRRQNGQCGGFEGGARDSDTGGSPSGRPRCYRRGRGSHLRVGRVLGQMAADTRNRSWSPQPPALGTSAVPPCWCAHRLMCPCQPPRLWAFAATMRSPGKL